MGLLSLNNFIFVIIVNLFFYNHCIISKVLLKDEFYETLLLKPLPDGLVHAFFEFKSIFHQEIENLSLESQYNLFPLAIGRFISKYSIKEIRLSLTKGYWRTRFWGYPLINQANGAELLIAFQNNIPLSRTSKAWEQITNVLSGHFCASFNFIDKAITVQPVYSFRPKGVFIKNSFKNETLYYGALPHEAVCTENLTRWKKLLPCFSKAGLASLLNAVQIINTNYFSLSLDVKSICRNAKCDKSSTEMVQTYSIVFNPTIMFQGNLRWSVIKFFGTSLKEECKLATKSRLYVETTLNNTENPSTLSPPPETIVTLDLPNDKRTFAQYDVRKVLEHNRELNISKFNIANLHQKRHSHQFIQPPSITASRFITGYGVAQGGLSCRIENSSEEEIKIIYFDVIPWYLRIYIHTMTINNNIFGEIKPEKLYYKPAKDRSRPHHIEMILTLPKQSTTTIEFSFERAFLKWTEYPPDANHGVYAGSATITFRSKNTHNMTLIPDSANSIDHLLQLKTKNLLIYLSTPDFSMPYNVICLVSTLVSLAFGPIHNLTTRSAKAAIDENESKLEKMKSFFKKILKKNY